MSEDNYIHEIKSPLLRRIAMVMPMTILTVGASVYIVLAMLFRPRKWKTHLTIFLYLLSNSFKSMWFGYPHTQLTEIVEETEKLLESK